MTNKSIAPSFFTDSRLQYCTNCFGWHLINYYYNEYINRHWTKCQNCGNIHDLTRQKEICNEVKS